MAKRNKRKESARYRPVLEQLESRELLTTLIEGSAPNDLSGFAAAPLGNVFDDPTGGLVGDDFVISAPNGAGGRGEVYVVFGGVHLDQTPNVQEGCILPPARVDNCTYIDTLLNNRQALRIRGVDVGDLTGYSVAGVGDVVADSRPDLLIGAPFARGAGGDRPGRAYLIGGDFIASVISAARTAATGVATIDLATALASPSPTATLRTFDGRTDGDQAGISVSGIGNGFYMVGAPNFGVAPKQQRGAVYIFAPQRGLAGPGTLAPITTIVGPSFNSHLGGLPVNTAEFLAGTGTNLKSASISGIKNPALIQPATELPNDPRYDVFGGFEPDVLVGAPDACVDNDCVAADADRRGRVYLLSGTALLSIRGNFDLSVDADLKGMNAIVVQGAENGDRLGTTVSSAGDLDGDFVDRDGDGVIDGKSDFMFSAPGRDVVTAPGARANDVGEVYLVFGREVDDNPFPNGNCRTDPSRTSGPQQNFRQCRDATGAVVPLDVDDFLIAGNLTGLTLRGDTATEGAGTSLSEAGNFQDPVGFRVLAVPSFAGVGDILIGAPFHDGVNPATGAFSPDIGRFYTVFGSRDYALVSGLLVNLNTVGASQLGSLVNGRNTGDHYGIAVAAAGNVLDPVGSLGADILVGASRVEVTLPSAPGPSPNVGETELFFGTTGLDLEIISVFSLLPFVQPGPFGPQINIAGYWSYSNVRPVAGSIVQYPLIPSDVFTGTPESPFLHPPYTEALFPPGSVGPFVPTGLYTAVFLPEKPVPLVDRAGHLNVVGGRMGAGVNVTATLKSPKVRAGAVASTSTDGTTSVFALDAHGHLIHHRGTPDAWYAVDLTAGARGPALAGNLSIQRTGTPTNPSFVVSGQTATGQTVVYAGNDFRGWTSLNLSDPNSQPTTPAPSIGNVKKAKKARSSTAVNYIVDGSGHLVQLWQRKRSWQTFDITAAAGGPNVQGDAAATFSVSSTGVVIEVFARSTNNHLIRYSKTGRGAWVAEDITAQIGGTVDGPIVTASTGLNQRFIYAQSGGKLIEISSDWTGWHATTLPLPSGTSSVSGPVAAVANGNTRIVFAYAPNGSILQYEFNGNWTVDVSNTTALASILGLGR